MKITEIEKAKGSRYNVYVDDEYWFNLDVETVAVCSLKKDLEVTEEFLDDIKSKAERRKARERAYYLLGYRDHSKKELYKKLLKSAREEICLEIILMVEEQGLIDDRKYAVKLANHYLAIKKWGARRAEQEMRKRGIDKADINYALSLCDVDSVKQIMEVIDKKYSYRLNDYKEKQKVIAALLRLGFDYSDIKLAISEYSNTEYEYD